MTSSPRANARSDIRRRISGPAKRLLSCMMSNMTKGSIKIETTTTGPTYRQRSLITTSDKRDVLVVNRQVKTTRPRR